MTNNFGNKETMAKNLKYYMEKKNISQTELSDALSIPATTISNWMHANTYPRIDKIELMANYFGISKSDLVEDRSTEPNEDEYYLNPETKKVAQEIFENKELSLLFDAAKDASPEDIKTIHSMLLALKAKEGK